MNKKIYSNDTKTTEVWIGEPPNFKSVCHIAYKYRIMPKNCSTKTAIQKWKAEVENEVRVMELLHGYPKIVRLVAKPIEDIPNKCFIIGMEGITATLQGIINAMHNKKQKVKINFNEPKIARICFEILDAIKHVHRNNIIHMDITASNIFINFQEGPIVKIGDFSNSIIMTDDTVPFSDKFLPDLLDSKRFLKPPEFKNKHPFDMKVDIWSFGILLLNMMFLKMPLSGTPPGAGSQCSWTKDLVNMASRKVDSINQQDWSDDLVDFLNNCLVVDPTRRSNADELSSHAFIERRSVEKEGIIGDNFENWLFKHFMGYEFEDLHNYPLR